MSSWCCPSSLRPLDLWSHFLIVFAPFPCATNDYDSWEVAILLGFFRNMWDHVRQSQSLMGFRHFSNDWTGNCRASSGRRSNPISPKSSHWFFNDFFNWTYRHCPWSMWAKTNILVTFTEMYPPKWIRNLGVDNPSTCMSRWYNFHFHARWALASWNGRCIGYTQYQLNHQNICFLNN